MYTNTSKFRVNGKYGLFTISKGILNDLGWKPKDLIGFWGIDGKVIHIQRVCTKEILSKIKKEELKYNADVYKRIAKFGGETGTCGIKSLPEFLMKEFNPKDKQKIYFLPAKYTWFTEHYPEAMLKNIIFAAFNPDYLNKNNISDKKMEENSWRINKDGKLIKDTRKKNLKTKKERMGGYMWERDRLLGIELELKKLKKWIKTIKKSNHKDKDQLIEMHEDRKIILGKEKKILEKVFKEKFSKKTKRRYNYKNLSPS